MNLILIISNALCIYLLIGCCVAMGCVRADRESRGKVTVENLKTVALMMIGWLPGLVVEIRRFLKAGM